MGNFNLKRTEQQNNIFYIKVLGFSHLTTSPTNNIAVGIIEAKVVAIIWPDADQLNTSIYPGVSIINIYPWLFFFSLTYSIRVSILPANKFNDVIIPPLGPNLYSFIVFL